MDIVEKREQARRFLRGHPTSAEKLAKRLDLPYWWIVKFRSGKIVNPSFERLQRVLDFMAADRSKAA